MSVSDPPFPAGVPDSDTPTWVDIVEPYMWGPAVAACGCDWYQHLRYEPLGAAVHSPDRCAQGLDVASVDVELGVLLGVHPLASDTHVNLTKAEMAARLRCISSDLAFAAVRAERASEAVYEKAGYVKRNLLPADHDATAARAVEAATAVYASAGFIRPPATQLRPEDFENPDWQEGFKEGFAEREALFETVRQNLTAAEYDSLLDDLPLSDQDLVTKRLKAKVAEIGARTNCAAVPAPALRQVGSVGIAPLGGVAATQPEPIVSDPAPAARYLPSWRAEVEPLEDQLFDLTPGLRQVAAAADALGAGRQGVLGAVLARVAVATPPRVRLLTSSGRRGGPSQGGSLNTYVALVGKPHSGKTTTMEAAECLVPIPEYSLIPEGTAEGIIKSFGFMRREKSDEDGNCNYIFTPITDAALMIGDEIEGVLAEMCRQGTKFGPVWRSMWMGAMVGTTTGNVELRTRLMPHTYRLSVLLGCQPSATIGIWDEASKGTPQRILWLLATRRLGNGRELPPPLQLAYTSPAVLPDGTPSGEEAPAWMDWPPAARSEIEAELAAQAEDSDPYGENEDLEAEGDDAIVALLGHATFMRLKIMALLAIMDGSEQPSDLHWHAAGIVMHLRACCIRRTKQQSVRFGKAEAGRRGAVQGIQRATAKLSEDAAAADFDAELGARIITVLCRLMRAGNTPTTAAAISRLCSKKQQPQVPKKLGRMIAAGVLTVDMAGIYSIIPRLG